METLVSISIRSGLRCCPCLARGSMPLGQRLGEGLRQDQDWTSLSRDPMSGNPGDTDVLHNPSDGDPMDIDDLISNDSESPLPTGGDRPIDHCHVENNAMIISEDRHSDTTALLPSLDLADRIRGYRLLELISEQASSGLVNKVIISQEPLSRFIN
ncbi:hypothetical protein JB92DRAFT_1917254 [Gautieria morchelliformis]|nr:hypothetical protein JB92DRAFT_1917254 [Gautieria morchelliformis]